MKYQKKTTVLICCFVFFLNCIFFDDVSGNDRIITKLRPGWEFSTPVYGSKSGETLIDVNFPAKVKNMPLTFGIPLGQAENPENIKMTDEKGAVVPAAFIPLCKGTPPVKWYLVSSMVSSNKSSCSKRFKINWGDKKEKSGSGRIKMLKKEHVLEIGNGKFSVNISDTGVLSFIEKSNKYLSVRPSIKIKETPAYYSGPGRFKTIYDTDLYKKIRFESSLTDSMHIHIEYDFWYGSPYIKYSVRYINGSYSDISLDSISPAELSTDGAIYAVFGSGDYCSQRTNAFEFYQGAFNNRFKTGNNYISLKEDETESAWTGIDFGKKTDLMIFIPDFRGMAAGEETLENRLVFDGKSLNTEYYKKKDEKADIRIRETMARTFVFWIAIGDGKTDFKNEATVLSNFPGVKYDRKYLTDMGVFQEKEVSHLFDKESENGAGYFIRARVPRAEYPRCGRGTEPGYDGEGLFEVNLHAGGMVYGEVYQYFTPKPDSTIYKHYMDTLGIDKKHIITGGQFSYRNGDISLSLFQQYMRSGNRDIKKLAEIHTLLFSDYAVSHADGKGCGLGHYYCDWYGNPYVYQRFEGLLTGYLVTGEKWFFESAEKMAEYTLGAWESGYPKDGTLWGGFSGIQSRSAYIAKMCLKMYDVTGDEKYLDNAVKLAEISIETQEPEGWWVMNPQNRVESRKFRCTPIFSGYICQGLWPVYWRSGNKTLENSLLKAADWYISVQENASGSNPGTFPNSYWYGKNGSEENPVYPIRGNYATTTHAANSLLQAYLATGNADYFYGSNAAWVGVINNLTPEGGVPLESTKSGSVWSHVLVESLPDFGSTAEMRKLPVVLSSLTYEPGTSFMGKGASYKNGVFTFDLKHKSEKPVIVRVFFPERKPESVKDGENKISGFNYNEKDKTLSFIIPESPDFRVSHIEIK